MSEYIRREDAIDKINERQRKLIYCFGFENDAVKIMDIAKSIIIAISAVDVVPVVRCKYCRYRVNSDKCCHPDGMLRSKDSDFCSYGKGKE